MNKVAIERSEVAKDWHARGFTCGLWIDHAGRAWSDDQQEHDELFMPLSGELELELFGKRFKPEIGEEVLIPARVMYTVRNIGARTARWLYGQKIRNGSLLMGS